MLTEYLADRIKLLPELAQLHFAEWGHWRPGKNVAVWQFNTKAYATAVTNCRNLSVTTCWDLTWRNGNNPVKNDNARKRVFGMVTPIHV